MGGSFDPPHLGHIICSRVVAEALNLEQVIIMPVAIQPQRLTGTTASKEARYRMMQAISTLDPIFQPSRLEIDRSGISYTIDTVEQLAKDHPNDIYELYWIIGMDSAIHLNSWRKPYDILNNAQIAVMQRPGFKSNDIPSAWRKSLTLVETPHIDISSTKIRQRIADNLPVRLWVGEEVEKVILNEHLYIL